jgi:hypothetical protein
MNYSSETDHMISASYGCAGLATNILRYRRKTRIIRIRAVIAMQKSNMLAKRLGHADHFCFRPDDRGRTDNLTRHNLL